MSGRAEAVALAHRLVAVDTNTAGDCRRALLLYWYGCGASRLRLDDDIAIRVELPELSARVGAVAADAHPSAEEIRQIGLTLDALVRPLAAAPSPPRG